jgi:hypothetical protein
MAAAQQSAAAELLAIRSRTAEEEKDVQGRFEHALEAGAYTGPLFSSA